MDFRKSWATYDTLREVVQFIKSTVTGSASPSVVAELALRLRVRSPRLPWSASRRRRLPFLHSNTSSLLSFHLFLGSRSAQYVWRCLLKLFAIPMT